MSKIPIPLSDVELEAIASAIDRPGVRDAMGLHMAPTTSTKQGDTGTALRRAVNAIMAARSKARADNAKRTLATPNEHG